MKTLLHKLSDSANPDSPSVWWAALLLLAIVLLVWRVLVPQVRKWFPRRTAPRVRHGADWWRDKKGRENDSRGNY